MKTKRSGIFQRQSTRIKFRLNRTIAALSLITLLAGGGLFMYLNTGKVQTSKAAETGLVVVTDPEIETGLNIAVSQRNSAAERYSSRSIQNDNYVFVRSLK